MGERKIDLGKYKRNDEKADRMKRALMTLLNYEKIEGVTCEFEDTILVDGKIHIFALINWEEKNDIKDIRIGRQVDDVISKL